MKLSYSTLACPGWTWRQAIDTASSLGYHGVEWRLVDGKMIDSGFPVPQAVEIRKAMAEADLEVSALDTSVQLTVAPGPERDELLAAVRRYLTLAEAFGASFLRVFAGTYPPAIEDAQARDWTRDVLLALQPAVESAEVRLAIELHDCGWDRAGSRGVTSSRFISDVLTAASLRGVGIQWDVGNAVAEGETPTDTWHNVAPWLTYLQVKDMARSADGSWTYVPMGTGELPIAEILDTVRGAGFDGWVSFEWEKWWHPEIAEPETVLPGFIAYLSSYLAGR